MSEPLGDWHEPVYEYAIEIGRLLGFDVHDIRFSGFWSQGDGASWSGYIRPKKAELQEALERTHGDTWIRAIVEELAPLVLMPKMGFSVIYGNSRYCHEDTIAVQYVSGDEEYLDEWVEQSIEWAAKEFAKWIYAQLEKEYEYITNETEVI